MRSDDTTSGFASRSAINLSNAASAFPLLWNLHATRALHCLRNVVSCCSKPFAWLLPSSVEVASGSTAPSRTAARTVSGNLNIAPERTVAVMMNAKDIVSAADPVAAIRQVFAAKANSRVDMVRFAALYKEVEPLAPAIEELHRLGYRVALNMMQVSDRTPAEIVTFGRMCKSMGVEVAYIADSFGGLRPSDLPPIIHSLLEGFEGPVGCHLHDNMTYALASTLASVDAGATWADATVLGMGRGPGNVRTEYLAPELVRLGRSSIDVSQLVNLVARDFTDLQRTHEWGSNLYYFLSANYG
ncbi:MAG: hypothetical protein EBZ55_06730, partial [Actinobacteria bacterium]|nr:hypothetical protein [Actinomycetota bacterium]